MESRAIQKPIERNGLIGVGVIKSAGWASKFIDDLTNIDPIPAKQNAIGDGEFRVAMVWFKNPVDAFRFGKAVQSM